ncbi:MAG: hypothetical protein COZ31_02980 [Nitrospirae bacterium CG_4_10_14_3_um_filter_44_29]|nr:MAG: hypothetical protein AUJ60_08705 [Nitrospirae bacterium CG1_02_44_142]PIP70728.1 MAG: hypothetical protein COW90_03685 [Nitrospirae bacterium CG22_combo_CG10-13_8_21_14_all_44_11]PIX89260.1 MAG: hypothetical protein COZ31_02980 [Nitrospirae bacterium CG_4_10_14_3_um_filter_44_29]
MNENKKRLFPVALSALLCIFVSSFFNKFRPAFWTLKRISICVQFYLFKLKNTCSAVRFAFGSGFEITHASIERVFGKDTKLATLFGNLFLLLVTFIFKIKNYRLRFRIFCNQYVILFLQHRSDRFAARLAEIMSQKKTNNGDENANCP